MKPSIFNSVTFVAPLKPGSKLCWSGVNSVGKWNTKLHKLHIRNVKFQTDLGINATISAQSRNLPANDQAFSRKETPKQWAWYRHLNPASILQIHKLTPITLFYFASSNWYCALVSARLNKGNFRKTEPLLLEQHAITQERCSVSRLSMVDLPSIQKFYQCLTPSLAAQCLLTNSEQVLQFRFVFF